jgi:hypothetical protein
MTATNETTLAASDTADRLDPALLKIASERVDRDADDRRVELDRDRSDQHYPRDLHARTPPRVAASIRPADRARRDAGVSVSLLRGDASSLSRW